MHYATLEHYSKVDCPSVRKSSNDPARNKWLAAATKDLSPGLTSVFEVGSGEGQDARWLISQGFDVQCSDVSPVFVSKLLMAGIPAVRLNVLDMSYADMYDVVFAHEVLVHLSSAELDVALANLFKALRTPGRVVATFHAGIGSQLSPAGVFYQYWSAPAVVSKLKKEGFFEVFTSSLDDVSPGLFGVVGYKI